MTLKAPALRLRQNSWIKFVLIGAVFYPLGVMAQSQTQHVISQKKRTYAPGAIEIKTGDSLKIVNDDLFIHHAFVDSDTLQFDSGSMDEGEHSVVTFDAPGTYQLKCAIHPKMNLDVTVN